VLDHYAWIDPRVRVKHRDHNGGIVAASNDALDLAAGEWVALLDHDDLLDPDALGAIANAVYEKPDSDVVYTDEDKVTVDGHHLDPFLKPDWDEERLFCQMYVGHLTAYRKSLVIEVGGFRAGYEGSQDWDLCLRATEKARRVQHVPRVLYSWRIVPGSTAVAVAEKPYTVLAAERAVRDALVRRGIAGDIEETGYPGYFRVRRTVTDYPLVSIVIPTAGGTREVGGVRTRLIDRCIAGLMDKTVYPHLEIICVLSQYTDESLMDDLRAIAGDKIRFLTSDTSFNFALTINRGAAHARGDMILMLNDDIEPIDPDWLTKMVELSTAGGVGAVGAKLLFENGTIQHAGVGHNLGQPFHIAREQPDRDGYFGELVLNAQYLAVTGACLLTPRAVFEEVGGMHLGYPVNYNDVDYCLKLYEYGYRVLNCAGARLYHYESSTRPPTVTVHEIHQFESQWLDLTRVDPFVNAERAHRGLLYT
jgi:GT2 family glycosyltransferase